MRNQGLFNLMTYTLYILQNSEDRFYIGQTSDLEKRIERHNAGDNPYTKHKGPWVLVYTEIFGNRGDAMIREKQLKKWRRELLLNLIQQFDN